MLQAQILTVEYFIEKGRLETALISTQRETVS